MISAKYTLSFYNIRQSLILHRYTMANNFDKYKKYFCYFQ
jgi:hypothetical protein